jgi:hypothetical protein
VANPPSPRFRHAGALLVVAWLGTFIAARLFLDTDLQERLQSPAGWRVAVALAPVLPTAVFLWAAIRSIRSLDELHRRVHLEALVIAYPLAVLLLVTLGLLELAIDLPAEDWSYRHLWPYLMAFYAIGLTISWKRYK